MRSLSGKYTLWASALLCLATVVIYSNTLDAPFHFDDKPNILSNPHIRLTHLSLEGLTDAATKSHLPNRPVSNISFALNYLLHEYDVAGYHVTNIFIHLVTGVALFFLLQSTLATPALRPQFKPDSPLPFIAALLWTVHPLHTQSVTYIVQRMNSMAALFYVLSLLFYVRGRLAKGDQPTWPWFAGCGFCGLMALGSKQIAATLPFFVLLYEWYFIQDLKCTWFKKFSVYALGSLILTVVLTAIYLGQNSWQILLLPSVQTGFSTAERLLTQSRVVLYYVSLLLFPHPSRLNLDYDFPVSHSLIDPATTLFSVFILVSLIGVALCTARRQRLISFAILWYLGNLAIESSVASLEMVYEHRTYLPSMFLLLAFVFPPFRWVHHERAVLAATAAVILVFCLWTYQRNEVWKDPVALWRTSAEKSVTKARPYNNLGNALSSAGRPEEAIRCYTEALRRDPKYYAAHISIGAALMTQGKLDEAISHYTDALKTKPDYAPIHQSLGIAFTREGNLDMALFHYEQALRLDPNYADAHAGIGVVLARKGQTNEAVSHYRKALAIDPENATAKTNLSNVLAGRQKETAEKTPIRQEEGQQPLGGRQEMNEGLISAQGGVTREGPALLSEALERNPVSAEDYFNRAVALSRLNRQEEAMENYLSALAIQPDHAQAHNNLGIILAVRGDLEKARDHFSAALKALPDFNEARNNLERAENLLKARHKR